MFCMEFDWEQFFMLLLAGTGFKSTDIITFIYVLSTDEKFTYMGFMITFWTLRLYLSIINRYSRSVWMTGGIVESKKVIYIFKTFTDIYWIAIPHSKI
jgi:hypothetical protein